MRAYGWLQSFMYFLWPRIILVLNVAIFLLLCQPVAAASLEITAPPTLELPTLVFVEAENSVTIPTSENSATEPEFVSDQLTFKPAIHVLLTGTELTVTNADPIPYNTHVFDHECTDSGG